jgi:hypothetical protein
MKYCLIIMVIFVAVGCSKTSNENVKSDVSTDAAPNGLTRPMVLELINKQLAPKQIFAHMSTDSRGLSDFTPLYKQMIDEKLITCQWSESCLCWVKCRPTEERLEDIRVETPEQGLVAGSLWLEMGWKEVKEVVGISKLSDTSAMAEYLVVYQPFDSSRPEPAIVAKYQQVFRMDNRDTERHRVFLRLFDDGWRIERFD